MIGTDNTHARRANTTRIYRVGKTAPRILKLALGGEVVRCFECGALIVVDVPDHDITLAEVARTHRPSACQSTQVTEGGTE